MTIKERLHQRIEQMSEEELLRFERELNQNQRSQLSVEERLKLWDALAQEPQNEEDWAEFEAVTGRRPLFGNRGLDLEPDA